MSPMHNKTTVSSFPQIHGLHKTLEAPSKGWNERNPESLQRILSRCPFGLIQTKIYIYISCLEYMAKLPEKKVIIQINPSQFSQKMVLESNVADIMGTCNHPTLKKTQKG